MSFLAGLALAVVFAGAPVAAQAASPQPAPVANATTLAVYVPPSDLTSRGYLTRINVWIEPGKALSDALDEVVPLYFPNRTLLPAPAGQKYGLLLDIDPTWTPVTGKVHLTLRYDVYDPDGKKLHGDSVDRIIPVKGTNFNAAAFSASRQAVQAMLQDIGRQVGPSPEAFPARGETAKIDPALLVDHAKPLRTGTAFFINRSGQLLTAAHVARDCTLLEAHQDDKTFVVTAKAASDLLDVAVLDSTRPREKPLVFRDGQAIQLGESVTSVGYPLHGLLGDSPNLTRGNVSATKGIRGSLGHFQFSAPIQPGNSGGPIVSDNGEVLGIAVSTLNAESLVKDGLIPQNVNFALDARHVVAFLRREGVAFDLSKPQGAGSMQIANEAALANTVQLNCYQ
jgi:S1-C subfamily serine protease